MLHVGLSYYWCDLVPPSKVAGEINHEEFILLAWPCPSWLRCKGTRGLSKRENPADGFHVVRSPRKGSKTVAREILGTGGQHKKTQELLCQEYTLQSDRIIYRIRPKDDKHLVLLPVGETAHSRLHKDKLILQPPEADPKEHEYTVVSMTPRQGVTCQVANKN